jgi:hypothetical protein
MRQIMKTLHLLVPVAVSLASASAAAKSAHPLFLASDNCMACHQGMSTAKGEDVSIAYDWRSSMMAQAARDPYWQASVRREIGEHAVATAAIEDECSRCHMPMDNERARAAGGHGQVFANLGRNATDPNAALAHDGVSCTVCHQIEPDNLGKPESFVGGFVIDRSDRQPRKAMGPYQVKPPVARMMASATTFYPTEAPHLGNAELCATCHTLYTEALGPDGKTIGRLPEQVPYLEWLASDYRQGPTCQGCHMPEVGDPAPIANIFAEPRTQVGRHEFLGGNFLVPVMLKTLGLAMPALPEDLDRTAERTRAFLGEQSAKLSIGEVRVRELALESQITVENSTGHKLPTAYPSRRVWLHIKVKDAAGKLVFESGAIDGHGHIAGNDNDDDATRFEPHHRMIEKPDQVQIYEPILGDAQGRVTTGLLSAVGYLKDNRILPSGFDKKKAVSDVAVHGDALADDDFTDGSDRLQLRVAIDEKAAPFKVEVELLYQPIGFRWAQNLRAVAGAEPKVFVRAYDALAAASFHRLAAAERSSPASAP